MPSGTDRDNEHRADCERGENFDRLESLRRFGDLGPVLLSIARPDPATARQCALIEKEAIYGLTEDEERELNELSSNPNA